MSQQVEGRTKTFLAGGALAIHRRVRLSTGKLAYCGTTDTDGIGVTPMPVFAANDPLPIVLASAQGTRKGVAAGTFAAGVGLYAAANGTIDDSGTVLVGISLEAATAISDVVEYIPATTTPASTWARSTLTQDDLQPYPILVSALRVWDSPGTNAVVATGANDDLAVVYGTFGTAAPTVETGDVKGTTSARKVGFQFAVPPEYVAGQTLEVRVNAGMKTTVADTSATVDVEATRQAAPTVDICATAAQSINSLTPANKDFVLTPTDLVPGDVLDLVVTINWADTQTATAVIGKINSLKLLADIQG